MQKLQPLRRQFTADNVDARRAAARLGDAGDESKVDRIFGEDEHDGDRRGCRFGRERRSVAARDEDRNLSAHQFERQRGQSVVFAFGPAVFDRNVLAHDIAGLLEALLKCARTAQSWRCSAKIPDHRHRATLLRARRPNYRRRGRRATEKRDELAAPHSITSSARASSEGGTSSPSAFAVLRLITSSYLVGACTGRSAGLSPLRMRW